VTLSNSEIIEELESWEPFAEALRTEDRETFKEMLRLYHVYFPAIQALESPFPSEGLLMSILLTQHKTIVWLAHEIKKLKGEKVLGWILDLYPGNAGEMVIWSKREDGQLTRLVDRWSPSIFITTNDVRLQHPSTSARPRVGVYEDG
jgi:hypothetical protein